MPIRPLDPADLGACYEVCLQTGDSGADGTELFSQPDLLGDLFVGAYAAFEPELAFVLEDAQGVGGYVFGALDTRAFEARCNKKWWPSLRKKYPEPDTADADNWGAEEWMTLLIHHDVSADDAVVATYPSHLHIDIVSRLQKQGHGGLLMGTLLEALQAAGSPGVHLDTSTRNTNSIAFYRHLGFEELAANEMLVTFGMTL